MLRAPAHPIAMARFGLRGLCPRARSRAVRHAGRQGPDRGPRSPFDAAAQRARHRRLRTAARHALPHRRLAGRGGGSAGVVDALAAKIEAAGGRLPPAAGSATCKSFQAAADAARPHAPPAAEIAGRPDAGTLPPCPRALSLRPRRLQGRLGSGGPVPWQAEVCRDHADAAPGRRFEEIARSESEVAGGRHAERPYCIAVQPCVVDHSRAPAGQQTFYAYCHVPSGSSLDVSGRIEAQIERFAPGFRDLVLGKDRDRPQPRSSPTIPTTSAATSTPAPRPWCRRSFARRSACTPTARRCPASTSAPPRRLPAAACTGCAGLARRRPRLPICVADTARRQAHCLRPSGDTLRT